MYQSLVFFTVLALSHLALCQKATLRIGALFPISAGSRLGATGRQLIPASEMALEMVNNRADILPGYHLAMFWNDTKCNPGYGINMFYESVYKRPKMLMMLGAGCSSVTQIVAEAAARYNLVQISYASTASDLSDKTKYPFLYRVVPSDSALNAARIAFLKYFKWNRIATLREDAFVFAGVTKKFQETLSRQNFTVVSSEIFTDDIRRSLQELKQKDARIIVAMFYKDKARKVFCEAYKQGMYGMKYVWLLLGWHDNAQWWLEDDASIDCTKNQMMAAAQGYFSIESIGIVHDNTPTLSQMTREDLLKALNSRIPSNQSNIYVPFAFDSVWVIALTLNNSMERLKKANKSLEDFDYNDMEFPSIFLSVLKGLKFQGITGSVQFNSKGERAHSTRVKQMQDGHSVTVGTFYSSTNVIVFNGSKQVHWQGDGVPSDRTEVVVQMEYVSLTLFCVITVLATLGILLALTFLCFNVRYRNHSYIKLSNPNFNNLVILGCVMLYMSTYFIAMDGRTIPRSALPGVCASRGYLLAIGYSIALGVMFSKTWRVYQISNMSPKKVSKDGEMFVVIMIMVFIDILVMSVWIAVDMPELTSHTSNSQNNEEDDIIIVHTYEVCQSRHITTWLYIIMGYKMLLLLVLCFLTWVTRNVKARALNDSRFIAFSVYNIVLFVIFGVPLTFLVQENTNAYVGILCLCIIIPTTILLCLLFIPKIITVRKKPEEVTRLQSLSAIHDTIDTSTTGLHPITRLQAEVLKLKREINELKSGKNKSEQSVINKGSAKPSRSPRPGLTKRARTCHSAQELAIPSRVRKRSRSLNLKSFFQECDDPVLILKTENQELKRHVQEFKINETGKLAKLMCENAELRRQVLDLNERTAAPTDTDTTTRLMEENTQLKKQLGEVSIWNSVWSDTTSTLERRQAGDRKISRELRELTHLLTVDLGCQKARTLDSTRLKRLSPIGHSQSATDLLPERDETDGASNSNMVEFEDDVFRDDTVMPSEVQIVVRNSDNEHVQITTASNFELGRNTGARTSQVQDLSADATTERAAKENLERDENHNSYTNGWQDNGLLCAVPSSNGVINTSKRWQCSTSSTSNSSKDVREADTANNDFYTTCPQGNCTPGKRKDRKKTEKPHHDKIEKTYFV